MAIGVIIVPLVGCCVTLDAYVGRVLMLLVVASFAWPASTRFCNRWCPCRSTKSYVA